MTATMPAQCLLCARHGHHAGEPCIPSCRRSDVAQGLLLCRRCYERVDDHLRDVPELYALAGAEMLPGASGGGGAVSEVSIGFRVSALDLRAGGTVLERLATWERDWRETFSLDPVRSGAYLAGSTSGRVQALDRYARGSHDAVGATLVGVVAFLRRELHRACTEHYAIDEFAHDVASIHADATSAARIGSRPGWTVECPADLGTGICRVHLRVTGEHFGGSVTCPRCRTEWDVSRLLRVTMSTREADVWLPPEELALLVGINASTLRRWAVRGLVRRTGGRYSVDDVRAAIAAGTPRKEGTP